LVVFLAQHDLVSLKSLVAQPHTATVSHTLGKNGFASERKDGHGYMCTSVPEGTEVRWFWPITERDRHGAAAISPTERATPSELLQRWRDDKATRLQLEQLQTCLERAGYRVRRINFSVGKFHSRLLVQQVIPLE
jgi:hypothetical protein